MSPRKIKFSERQQVVVIIVAIVAVLGALWFFLLKPMRSQRKAIENKRIQIAKKFGSSDKPSLEAALKVASIELATVQAEWQQATSRLATFADQADLARREVGRIDFKVKLFHERRRLLEKSETLGIPLVPTGLGFGDDVTSNNDARTMMIQLRAVEQLADLVLDLGINRLLKIEPLSQITHTYTPYKKDKKGRSLPSETSFEEYPVVIEFETTLEKLYTLIHAVMIKNQVYVFKKIRINAGPSKEAPLHVVAEMSALLFPAHSKGAG